MNEPIGERLKRAREERHFTIQQAAEITRIRPHYLEALERGDLSAIPSTAQARGFLRIYADFLGLKPDEFVPIARPPEIQPVSEPPPSQADLPAAPVESTSSSASTDAAKPRRNFLSSLRDRFTRRVPTQASVPPSAASEPESIQSLAREAESFVPVRSREELSAPVTSSVEKATPQTGSKVVGTSVKGKRISGKKAGVGKPAVQSKATKKPVSKTNGSSESDGDRRTTPKKKVKVK
jgi:transcriptional regulator with XRE-family HTH domain